MELDIHVTTNSFMPESEEFLFKAAEELKPFMKKICEATDEWSPHITIHWEG